MSNDDERRERHCRCCGAEVKHNGWLDVCDNPECVRKGTRDHFRKKHLGIFRAGGYYGVGVCDFDDSDCVEVRTAYFATKVQAEAFAAYVRTGISKAELAALVEAHAIPHERITVEELRRRGQEQ